jgi:hypothetical protein
MTFLLDYCTVDERIGPTISNKSFVFGLFSSAVLAADSRQQTAAFCVDLLLVASLRRAAPSRNQGAVETPNGLFV